MFFGGDPFEHFAGMHGGPGGGSRRSAAPPRDVDTTKLYETLGVSFSFLSFLFYRCSVSICYICMWGTIISATWLCFGYDVILRQDYPLITIQWTYNLPASPQQNNTIFRYDFTFECMPPQSDCISDEYHSNKFYCTWSNYMYIFVTVAGCQRWCLLCIHWDIAFHFVCLQIYLTKHSPSPHLYPTFICIIQWYVSNRWTRVQMKKKLKRPTES